MAKKQSKADFMRQWRLPPTFQWRNLRYKSPPEKGVYWYYFSIYIRQRDIERYGICISCGRGLTMQNADAGHFISANSCGISLLFDETNVNAECKSCNGFDEMHLLNYADGLDQRYGPGTSASLRERYHQHKSGLLVVKDWKGPEYADKIRLLPSYAQGRA